MTASTTKPRRSKRDVVPHPGVYRRSLLEGFQICARRERFNLQTGDVTTGYSGYSARLGQVFHMVAHRMLMTLSATGNSSMPTQEAVEVMYEVLGDCDIVLDADSLDDLRWLVLAFSKFEWTTERVWMAEEMLTLDITCQDGKVRTLTGRPDLLLWDGGRGNVVIDHKSGLGKPRSPRVPVPEGEPIRGKEYLSARGHFQLDTYGCLVMHRFPAIDYVILRELHLRSGEVREAVLYREELEHVVRQLGILMMQVDRAIQEGPKSELWSPMPGSQCIRQCPVNLTCPVPREARGIGVIETPAQERAAARAWQVAEAQYKRLGDALKARFVETEQTIPLGNGRGLRFDGGKGGAKVIIDFDDRPPEPVEAPVQLSVLEQEATT